MLRDAFNMHNCSFQSSAPEVLDLLKNNIRLNNFAKIRREEGDQEPNGEATKFYKLLKEMNKELYK